MGGNFHVDFLLLTSLGILVIDLRDVRGNIFGGDQMTEWTVMDGAQRTTFTNPQSGALRPHRRGEGGGGRRAGGRPHRVHAQRQVSQGPAEWTLMIDSLRVGIPAGRAHGLSSTVERVRRSLEAACGRPSRRAR